MLLSLLAAPEGSQSNLTNGAAAAALSADKSNGCKLDGHRKMKLSANLLSAISLDVNALRQRPDQTMGPAASRPIVGEKS